MKYLIFAFVLISCGNSKKQELMKLIEQNKDSMRYYAKAGMAVLDSPYPDNNIDKLKREMKLFDLSLQRTMFKDKIDSLKYEIQKLD